MHQHTVIHQNITHTIINSEQDAHNLHIKTQHLRTITTLAVSTVTWSQNQLFISKITSIKSLYHCTHLEQSRTKVQGNSWKTKKTWRKLPKTLKAKQKMVTITEQINEEKKKRLIICILHAVSSPLTTLWKLETVVTVTLTGLVKGQPKLAWKQRQCGGGGGGFSLTSAEFHGRFFALFLMYVEISSHTPIPLFKQGSVHSGTVAKCSLINCVYACFPERFPNIIM